MCRSPVNEECIMLMSIVDSLHNILTMSIQLNDDDGYVKCSRVRETTSNIYFIIELLKRLAGLVRGDWRLTKSRNMHQILSTCSIFMFTIHLDSLHLPTIVSLSISIFHKLKAFLDGNGKNRGYLIFVSQL